MVKVLIVDDEMLARLGVKSLLDWEANGFAVVGEADNGERALEMIRELAPEIVVTDYKMPVMDGVTLLLRCQALGLPAKFILLSAYSDYEYVRSTLKNGAVDYLLKLELEPETLLAALKKAASMLEKEHGLAARGQAGAQDIRAGALRHAYRQLINGCGAELASEHRRLIEELGRPSRRVMLIVYRMLGADKTELTARQFQDTVSPLVGVLEEICADYGKSVTLSLHREGLIATVLECGSEVEALNTASSLATRARETLKYLFNYTAFLGCSTIKPTLDGLGQAWCEASAAMHRALLFDLQVCMAQAQQSGRTEEGAVEAAVEALSRGVEKMDYAPVRAAFEQIYACLLAEKNMDSRQLIGTCYLAAFLLSSVRRRMGEDDTQVLERQQLQGRAIKSLAGPESAVSFLRQLELQFEKLLSAEDCTRSITKAKAYVQSHLSRDISLDEVAAFVALSPNYFSKLFHQRTGEKFTAYVTRQKINQAKALLLAGNHRIGEIAEQLGFENTTYFSKVFKKLTGVTPQNYKQNPSPGPG